MRSAAALGVAVLFGACASGGGGGGDMGMAFRVPDSGPLTYVRGDSMTSTLEIPGMGAIDIGIHQSYALEMTFAPSASGTEITAQVQDYNAVISNPVAGTERAGPADVDGAIVFTLDANGNAAVSASPEIRGQIAGNLMRPVEVANTVFPRLPGRTVSAGDTWADTIAFEEDTDAGVLEVLWSGTFTAGETEMWNGTSVRRVESRGSYSLSTAGNMQGMYIEQTQSGSTSGHFLWNEASGVIVYYESVRDLDGTLDADAAPAVMAVTSRSVVKTTLQSNRGR